MGADLPPDTSLLRRHAHPDGYGYGWLLVLILVSLAFQLGAPDDGVGAGADDRCSRG